MNHQKISQDKSSGPADPPGISMDQSTPPQTSPQNSTERNFEPFNVEQADQPLTQPPKHFERKHVFKFLIISSIVAAAVFLAAFLLIGGLSSLKNEARKATKDEQYFNAFQQRFHKIYPNETVKKYRFGIYSENQ